MKALLIYFIIFPYTLFSQQLSNESDKWLNESLNNKIVDSKELITEFIKYDFSKLWLQQQETRVGFIGKNFQRFYIHFNEIIQNDTNPSFYKIKGSTRVINNICTFEGKIKIIHIREIDKVQREESLKTAVDENDTELLRRFGSKKFIILTEYIFMEERNQKWSGYYHGIMKSNFYIKNNIVHYNDLDFSDSYSNNLCVGIWKSYKTGVEMKCCWGDYRIPYDGDLDGGTEFCPNEKYLKYGWQNYYNAYVKENQEAIKEEEKKWW